MPFKDAEAGRAYLNAYNAAHRQERRDYLAAYRLRIGVDEYNLRQRAHYRKWNPPPKRMTEEEHRERRRAYYLANRERNLAACQSWRERNRAKTVTYTTNRKARALLAGAHTTDEWTTKCSLLGDVCFYCGEPKPLAREHKVPLSRGGSNDIRNIVPACRTCNSRKGTKTAAEFIVSPR